MLKLQALKGVASQYPLVPPSQQKLSVWCSHLPVKVCLLNTRSNRIVYSQKSSLWITLRVMGQASTAMGSWVAGNVVSGRLHWGLPSSRENGPEFMYMMEALFGAAAARAMALAWVIARSVPMALNTDE